MIDISSLGLAPVGLFEESYEKAQHTLIAFGFAMMEYVLVEGKGVYVRTIDYKDVVLQ